MQPMHRADNLNHLRVPTVLKAGSLNFVEPLGPLQACIRTDFLPWLLGLCSVG
jgi:hypothetical protein